jgi:hypothetical protein
MIITKVVMYVKLMHNGLLGVAFYTPYHFWDLLKNGKWEEGINSLCLKQSTSQSLQKYVP